MRTRTLVAILAAVLSMGLTSFGGVTPAAGAQSSSADVGRRLVSVTGQSTTRPGLLVDVILAVPAGRNVEQAATDALRAQGARPVTPSTLGSDGFTTNGVVWPDATSTQSYNPAGEPVDGRSLLQAVQATWSDVSDSQFAVTVTDGTTDRCGSLVKECPGKQVTDGFNDVGWQRLKGSANTLGVAWSTASAPEVDIALNLAAGFWTEQLTEAVLLHEEGHFTGLGHSDDPGSVMYAYISNPPRTTLTPDDAEGLTYLYPAQTLEVSGRVTTDGTNAIAGATVQLVGTPYSATTGADGSYTLSSVPAPVTYDFRASGDGVVATDRGLIDSGHTTFDFVLAPTQQDSGGPGHCSDPANADHPSCRNR